MAKDKNKLIKKAQDLVLRGTLDKAIKLYEEALELDKKDVRLLMKLGECCQKKGDKDKSLEYYLQAAKFLTKDGFYSRAVAVYKQILQLDDSNLKTLENLADLYNKLGLNNEAMATFQKISEQHEKDGKLPEAIEGRKRMLDLDPKNVKIATKLAELYYKSGLKEEGHKASRIALNQLQEDGRHEEYLKILERIVKLDPDNGENLKELAEIYVDHDQWDRAYAVLNRIYKNDPENPDNVNQLADAALHAGRPDEAVKLLKALAAFYKGKGLRQRVKDVLRRVLEIKPDDAESLAVVGRSEPILKEKPPEAPKVVEQVIEAPLEVLDEGEVEEEVVIDTGEVLEGTDEEIEEEIAMVADEEEEEEAPSEMTDDQVTEHLTEADVYLKYGLRDKALGHIQTVLQAQPKNLRAHLKLKDIHKENGQKSKVIEELNLISGIALETGDHDLARISSQEWLQLEPQNAEAAKRLEQSKQAPAKAPASARPAAVKPAAPVEIDLVAEEVVEAEEEEEVEAVEEIEFEAPTAVEQTAETEEYEDDAVAQEEVEEEIEEEVEEEVEEEEESVVEDEDEEFEAEAEDEIEEEEVAEVEEEEIPAAAESAVADEFEVEAVEEEISQQEVVADEDEEEEILEEDEPVAKVAPDVTEFEISPVPVDASPSEAAKQELAEEEPVEFTVEPVKAEPPPPVIITPPAPAPVPGFADELEEAEFYIQQGIYDEARGIYTAILAKYPQHEVSLAKMKHLDSLEQARAAAPPPVPVEEIAPPAPVAIVAEPKPPPPPAPVPPPVQPKAPVQVKAPEPPPAFDPPPAFEPAPVMAPKPVSKPAPPPKPIEPPIPVEPVIPVKPVIPAPPPPPVQAATTPPPTPTAPAETSYSIDDLGPSDSIPAPEASITKDFFTPAAPPPSDDLFGDNGADDLFDLAAALESDDELANLGANLDSSSDDSAMLDIKAFKQGVADQISEHDSATHYDLGIAYKEMGLLDDALQEFLTSSRDPARHADCMMMSALIFRERGEFDKALESCSYALGAQADAKERAAVYHELYEIMTAQGEPGQAKWSLEQAKALDPNFPDLPPKLAALGNVASVPMTFEEETEAQQTVPAPAAPNPAKLPPAFDPAAKLPPPPEPPRRSPPPVKTGPPPSREQKTWEEAALEPRPETTEPAEKTAEDNQKKKRKKISYV